MSKDKKNPNKAPKPPSASGAAAKSKTPRKPADDTHRSHLIFQLERSKARFENIRKSLRDSATEQELGDELQTAFTIMTNALKLAGSLPADWKRKYNTYVSKRSTWVEGTELKIADKHRKRYEEMGLSAKEMDKLVVKTIVKKTVRCATSNGETFMIPVMHLTAAA